jgi:hypothetical protein
MKWDVGADVECAVWNLAGGYPVKCKVTKPQCPSKVQSDNNASTQPCRGIIENNVSTDVGSIVNLTRDRDVGKSS